MSDVLAELAAVIESRRDGDKAYSYTTRLLEDPELATRKLMEEAFEVCLELGRPEVDADRASSEAADLVYHLMSALASRGVDPLGFEGVLAGRRR